MPVLKLTPQFIASSLHCPPGKTRVEFCDSDVPGLYIAVRAASPGEGVYYLRWKDANNKTCHTKLGRTIDIDLAEARKAAKQLRAEIALGANPQAEARAAKAVPTVSGVLRAAIPALRQAPQAQLPSRRGDVPAAHQGDLRQLRS